MADAVFITKLTGSQAIIAYNSVIEEAFQAPWDRPTELVWPKVAWHKSPTDLRLPDGTVPLKAVFGFSPPNGHAMFMDDTGRQARPVTSHSIEVNSQVVSDTLKSKRRVFQADVLGLLKKIPRDLRRTEAKFPDLQVAKLLNNGKTAKDYRGENFFATGKVCSPEGMIPDTFDNLHTASPLTEVNLAKGCQTMKRRLGPDGVILGVNPTQLVVPQNLYHDAILATEMKMIVFSGSNPAPGQVTTTAAVGENPMAQALKYIKEVVAYSELEFSGQSIDSTTWYVQDTADGPQSLLYALFDTAKFVSLMAETDPNVFDADEYKWGYRKVEGFDYGLPMYLDRFEA